MKEFSFASSHKVILSALSLLTENGLCTNKTGLREILVGSNPDDRVKALDCYGHYVNLSKRAFSSRINMLIRYGFIKNVYREEISDYILDLTEKGIKEVTPIKWRKRKAKQSNVLEIRE